MRAILPVVASLVSLVALDAHATASHHATLAGVVMPTGRSIGSPTAGHLVGGAHLADAPYLRVMPADQAGDVRWGLGALVGMIDRVAMHVRHLFPGAVLNVGHLSKSGGGEIEQHASHESGRDADLPFYVEDTRHRQIFADHMVAFRADGTAPTWAGAHFDDAKNWALVAAVLEDPVARATHIFVSAPLRMRLLTYAAHAGVPEALRTRAAFTMVQPHGTLPHDDHFHVRIACPTGMTGCIENPLVRTARRGHVRTHASAESSATRERTHGTEPRGDDVAPEPTHHAAASGADQREGTAGEDRTATQENEE